MAEIAAVSASHRGHRRLPGRGQPREPARPGQRHPRLHGLPAEDGRGRRGQEGRPRGHARPLPHHGGLLHLVPRRSAGLSRYLLDKSLHTVDRDPELVERYREDPAGSVEWWKAELANSILHCHSGEKPTWLALTDEQRRALAEHDYVTLFEMGTHPFLTLTLFIAMFERDHGPLECQRAYGKAMEHLSLLYPDIGT